MRKLLFILALLVACAADAQDLAFGITGRFGTFSTLSSSSPNAGNSIKYGTGLQAGLGAWAQLSVATKGSLQFTVIHTVEHQKAGTITFFDDYRNPITDAAVADLNFSVNTIAVYLYTLNERCFFGAGAGAKYEYLSKGHIKTKQNSFNGMSVNESVVNHYRSKFRLFIPVETQYKLNEQVTIIGQVQVPLSNRLAAQETAFKERDLGLVVGINYTL